MQIDRRRLMRIGVGITHAVVVLAATSAPAMGQTDESRQNVAIAREVYVGGRVGAVRQSDLVNSKVGTGLGGGASVGFFVNRRWAVEADMWIPAYATWSASEFGFAEIRDRLLSMSAVRRRGRGRVRPYALIGVAVGREDERSHSVSRPGARVHSNKIGWIEFGVGALFPLSGRVALAPEVRVDTQLFTNIVRPSVALIYRLR